MIRMATIAALAALLTAGFALTGCGGESAAGAGGAAGDTAEVRISSDDRMRFDVTRFTVSSGQTVRLTLDHVGKMPVEHMGHNVVILKPGEKPVEFGIEVGRQGGNIENAYVPEPMRDRVVAFTAMIGGGQSDTITFVAPEPGEYPFLCTFPGHYGIMQGVMIVE